MRSFDYYNPTRLIFGRGVFRRVGSTLSELKDTLGIKCLIVYGSERIKKTGLFDQLSNQLQEHGFVVVAFGGVRPNPDLPTLKRAVDYARQEGVEFVIGFGGGSIMDMTKAIAAGIKYDGELWDMVFHGQAEYKPPIQALPIVQIPTLAATGSEMDPIAVITNPETRQKSFIRSKAIYPKISFVDPELTLTVPPDQTAFGISDMISHVTESYFNGPDGRPLQDRWAEAVIKIALDYGQIAVEHGDDIMAREQLQWASIVALNGWVQTGGDAPYPVHAIEHVFSAYYDIPHGAGLAVLNPAWMLWALKKIPYRFADFARAVFNIEDADPVIAGLKGINRLKEAFKTMGLPTTLRELSVPEEDWDRLAQTAIDTVGRVINNKRMLPAFTPMSKSDILEVFELAK